MADNWRDWGKSLGQNVLFTVLWALVPGAFMTYLVHVQSIWARPVLWGLGATTMLVVIASAIKAIARLPPRRTIPNSKNIESCVRLWLDNYRVSVRTDPSPESHFRFRITLDSGKLLTVVRMRDQDYVEILADLGVRGEDKKLLEQFSEEEIGQIFFDTRLELARAQVGYGGLQNPPENFFVTRRVPIHHNLTEFIFMSIIGSVEAAMNLVGLMYLKTKAEADKRKLKHAIPTTPQLASGTLPPAPQ